MTNFQHIKHMGIYLLIGIYSIVLLKPLLPFAQDFIAHTFYATEHTATVHFENGKYHVHKEVETAAKNQKKQSKENNTANSNLKIDAHYLSDILDLPKSTIRFHLTKEKIPLKGNLFLLETNLKTPYPPPQV